MENLIKKYAAYNLWANQRIAMLLDPVDEVRMNMDIISSFPSISLTLLHIWDAESIWLNRLKGTSFLLWPSDEFEGSKKELLEAFLETSKNFNDFILSQPTDYFDKTCHYSNTKGVNYQQKTSEIVQHCMNHSTFHRGQLVTLLRQIGETELVSTDFVTYLRRDF